MLQVLQLLMDHPAVGKHLKAPSVSYGTNNLYMRGPLEADTRPNLTKVSSLRRQQVDILDGRLLSCCCTMMS